MFSLSSIYSTRKSSNHKLFKNHEISPVHKTKHTQTSNKKFSKNLSLRYHPCLKKAHKARTRWYRGPFRRFINTRRIWRRSLPWPKTSPGSVPWQHLQVKHSIPPKKDNWLHLSTGDISPLTWTCGVNNITWRRVRTHGSICTAPKRFHVVFENNAAIRALCTLRWCLDKPPVCPGRRACTRALTGLA